jgi:VCBS repeat-containing protein
MGRDAVSLAIQLEPRLMYDGAGAPTAAAVAHKTDVPPPPPESAAVDQHATDPSGRAAAPGGDRTVTPNADVGPFGSKAEAQLAASARSDLAQPITEVVFVDGRLPDLGGLSARPGVQVVVLDPTKDGISQVTETLAGYHDLTAVHFVGHGESGEFTLGSTRVDAATLAARAGDIMSWSASLNTHADIMIWGCDVAEQPAGQALMSGLASLTGADVAASTDLTGAADRGGDWTLETSTGQIETAAPFEAASLATWDHLLDPPTISSSGKDTLTVAEPSSLNAAGADRSTLAAWNFNSTATGNVTVTATVGDTTVGTLSSTQGTAIAGGYSFTGSLADANAWLDGLVFTAADMERGTQSGKTTISLTISDQDGGTASKSIAAEVTPSNDPTALADHTASVTEGGNLTIGQTILVPNDPELTQGSQIPSQIVYRVTDDPAYGYLTLSGQRIGVNSIFTQQDVIDGKLVYVHTATGADQNTADGFSVLVNDGATPQANSDSARITLNVTPVNQAPTVSGSGAIYEGQPANAHDATGPQSVVGSFITADGGGDPGDSALQVRLTALPTHGTLYFTGTATVNGVAQTFTNHQITAAEVAAGFAFDYAARDGLTYANDGIDGAGGRPPNDSFGVTIIDGGGGSGTPASTNGTIQLTIRPVNDDPVWDTNSNQQAAVPTPTGDTATDYKVTLTTGMLNVTDVDSPDQNITFVVTSAAGLDQGRLVYNAGSSSYFIPQGGTFTLADVKAGRVQYWQIGGATAGQTDTFQFQVLDNATAPHWDPDGTQFERLGGVYTGPTSSDTLRNFDFTINLVETPKGRDGSLPDLNPVVGNTSSTYAGTNPDNGASFGQLSEGGTVVLTNGTGGQPGLNYTVSGVDPSQIVYTILGFDGAGPTWNGKLQKLVDGAWVDLSLYDTFTQADLNAGSVRFVHDNGEDFESSVRLEASAGILVSDGHGGFVTDKWDPTFTFYIKPVNDAPVATGSTDTVINEGDTVAITTGFLGFSDPDDAQSESYLEGTATLPAGGGDNYAVNHDTGHPLTFTVTSLPQHGTLQYRDDGGVWHDVTAGMTLDTALITGDAATTRLRYVHDGGEDRNDGFVVQATDRWNATSNTATVSFAITNVNDPPQIAQDPTATDPIGILPGTTTPGTGVNEPLTIVGEGSFAQITAAMLQAIDPDSTAEQVQYRITSAPAHGRIAYSVDGVNFVTIGVGSAFTQADVTAGRIYYLSNGDEPSGNTYPNTPDDKFVFTLADGAAEQTGREFWIYTKPVNDAPVVKAPSGPVNVTDTSTQVPGFSVSDPDLTSIIPGAEQDYLQVVVRLTHEDGTAFSLSEYADVQIGYDTASGVTVGSHGGTHDYLVLRGTQSQINAALNKLSVQFTTDRDDTYKVEVIADDRLRDASGNLIDQDPGASGVQPSANGGTQNQSETVSTGTPEAISGQDDFDWYVDRYVDAVPTTSALIGNISAASVTIRASSVNDPATLTSSGAAVVKEDQATFIGDQLNFAISDPESAAFGTPVTVRLSVPNGILDVGSDTGSVQVTGSGTGTLVLTGTAEDIQNLLNDHLTYKADPNVNDDLNGAADGDVTLSVSFDDTGSNLGSGDAANNPSDLAIAITIDPVNDAPTVGAGTGTVLLNGQTPVPGFSVGDIDISGDGAASATGEADFVQVTVRITDSAGNPLAQDKYADVILSSANDAGEDHVTFEIDDGYTGNHSALVIRGTLAQVNAYLAGLRVEFDGDLANSDQPYRVEVIADDRMRDVPTGTLTGSGSANGGPNDNGGNGTAPVPTPEIDPYQAVPADLDANVASNTRDLFPSGTNDPARIDLSGPISAPEGSTVQLTGIQVSDSDALGDTVTATVTLPSGFTIASVNGSTSDNPGHVTGVGTGTVSLTGTIDEINAALNSIRVQLPNSDGAPTDWNGQFDVTVVVNDGGYNGNRPTEPISGDTNDPRSNPGDFSYADGTSAALVTTRTFTVTVAPVNDAPVVSGDGTEVLDTVPEDVTNPAGKTVTQLFGGQFSDPTDAITGGSSSNTFAGVVVTGLTADSRQGAWQYFNGTTWVNIGGRDAAHGLVLGADTLVRFVPAADFHGTPNAMTVVLMDDSDGGNGSTVPGVGDVVNLSDAGATGGTTRYSDGTIVLSTAVSNVNDRPTAKDESLPSVNEDTTNPPGRSVDQLFGGDYGDARDNQTAITGGTDAATAFGGIAIIGNAATAGQGRWQYLLDGGTWTDISTSVSDTAALLLPKDAQLRFVPAGDYNGTPGGLTIRASDSPVTFVNGADISATVGDQTSTWSIAHALTTTVNPLNDAPVLAGTASDPTAVESGALGAGTAPVTLVDANTAGVSDLDLTTTPGLTSTVFGAGQIRVALGNFQAGDILAVQGGLPPGVTVTGGTDGTLTITLDADTTIAEVQGLIERITFANTTDNPTDYGANPTRTYTITVNDGNNAQGTANAGGPALDSNQITGTITVQDANDPPTAVDDTNSITEDGPASVGGNVIAGAAGGAGKDSDPDSTTLTVVGVTFGGDTETVGTRFKTDHGWLTLNADGTYTYEIDNSDPAVNALKTGDTLQDAVDYTISDGAGGTDTATLTITIQGRTDGGPTIVPIDGNGGATGEAEVQEHGLTDPSDTSETTAGTIAVTAADGLESITVGGRTVTLAELQNLGTTPIQIDTGEGTLTLTGFTPGNTVGGIPTDGNLTYSYTLKAAQNQPGSTESTDQIALIVTDAGDGTNTGTLTVRIIDDAPAAVNDNATIAEDTASVTGNVVANGGPSDNADSLGADGAAAGGAVTAISFGGNGKTVGGTGFDTAYGHLTLNADGSYSYVLDNGNPLVNRLKAGQILTETVNYTITDGDGDTSTATLTITIQGRTDGGPTIVPADNTANVMGEADVHEKGLTDPSDGSEITTGTVAISAADGLDSVTVGGTTLTLEQLNGLTSAPLTIDTGEGTLTLTGFTPQIVDGITRGGQLDYSYLLKAPQNQPAATESFDPIALTVTDAGGGTNTGTLTVRIVDDAPTATNDAAMIAEDTASVTGSVVTNDSPGADGYATSGAVTGVRFGTTDETVGTGFPTAYGHLTLNADGSYSYVLDNTNPAVNALKDNQQLQEVVSYTITDSDGETSTATLTITITGRTDGTPTIVPADNTTGVTGEADVHEKGLTDPSDTSEATTGTIALTSPDGLASIVVGGRTVTIAELNALGSTPVEIDTGEGTLTLTGFTPEIVDGITRGGQLDYSYLLKTPQDQPAATESFDPIALTVIDAGGITADGTLTVRIVDDVPTAEADANDIIEDSSSVTGNVVTNDSPGADGYASSGAVTGVRFGTTDETVGTRFDTTYGYLTLNADGSYTYVLNNSNPTVNALKDGDTLTEQIEYTITDGDGDTSMATLTITIHGHTDGDLSIVPDDGNGGAKGEAEVHEHGLTDPSDNSETTTGSVSVTTPDGLQSVTVGGTTVTLAELNDLGNTPVVIDTGIGTLTLTKFTPEAEVGGIPVQGTIEYTYTLKAPQDQPNSTESTDPIALEVTDVDGVTSAGTLTVRIVDDGPVAEADTADIAEDTTSVSGNVVANGGAGDVADSVGADGAPSSGPVTGVSFDGTGHEVGQGFDTAYGRLTLNADGSYTYEIDNGNPAVDGLKQGATLHEVVTYTITDADGETSTATLTLTIHGTNDAPTASTGELIDRSDIDGDKIGPVDVTGAFADVDVGDKLAYTAEGLPPGLVLDPETGLVTGVLDKSASRGGPDRNGIYTVKVTATDQEGASVTRTFQWTVSNPPPVAQDDANVTDANASVGGNVISGEPGPGRDSDPDGDSLTVVSVGGEQVSPEGTTVRGSHGGTFTLKPDGTYAFNPGNDFQDVGIGQTRTTTVSYTIADADGALATAFLTVTVRGQAGNNVAAFMNLPGYDRWGLMSDWSERTDLETEGWVADLEGEHIYRFTSVSQAISQRVLFRYTGMIEPGVLYYEATLGRSEQLPSWITFDRSTQVITAVPDENVEPGMYEVRVVARDPAGHEAESTLTIQVTRDDGKALEDIKARAQGGPVPLPPAVTPPPQQDRQGLQPPAVDGAQATAPSIPDKTTEQVPVKRQIPAVQDAPQETKAGDKTGGERHNASLSKTIHSFGATGRIIAAAQFLEALAEDHSRQ